MIWVDLIAVILLVFYVWFWCDIIRHVFGYNIRFRNMVLPQGSIGYPIIALLWIIWRTTP